MSFRPFLPPGDALRYSLVGRGEVLGHTGIELPMPNGSSRAWAFTPTAAFEGARTVIEAADRAGRDLRAAMGGDDGINAVAPARLPAAIDRVMRETPAGSRLVETQRDLVALGLELRDEEGRLVPTRAIAVRTMPIPARAAAEATQQFLDAGFAGPPFFGLSVVLAADAEPNER